MSGSSSVQVLTAFEYFWHSLYSAYSPSHHHHFHLRHLGWAVTQPSYTHLVLVIIPHNLSLQPPIIPTSLDSFQSVNISCVKRCSKLNTVRLRTLISLKWLETTGWKVLYVRAVYYCYFVCQEYTPLLCRAPLNKVHWVLYKENMIKKQIVAQCPCTHFINTLTPVLYVVGLVELP